MHSGNSLSPINVASIFSLESIAGILIGEDELIDITEISAALNSENSPADGDVDIDVDVD